MTKPRRGDIVEIDFLDHAEHDSGTRGDAAGLSFKVTGRVVSVNKHSINVETWCYQNRRCPKDSNVVRYTIVIGAIKKLAVLRKCGKRASRDQVRIRDGRYC
jgi:hypothetical protein